MKNSEPNIARHLKQFLAEYLTQQRGCSLHTVWSYRDALCSLLRHLQEMHGVAPNRIKVTDLSADNVMAFLNYLQKSRSNSDETRNLRLSAIRTFAKYLRWKEPTLTSDLEGLLAIPTERTSHQVLDFLNRDEMEAILEAPDGNTWSGKRDRALLPLCTTPAPEYLRSWAHSVTDVTLNPGGSFHFRGKGRKERVLPLWKCTVKILSKWITTNHLSPRSAALPQCPRCRHDAFRSRKASAGSCAEGRRCVSLDQEESGSRRTRCATRPPCTYSSRA